MILSDDARADEGDDVEYCDETNTYISGRIVKNTNGLYTITSALASEEAKTASEEAKTASEEAKTVTKRAHEIYVLRGVTLKDLEYIKATIKKMTPAEIQISDYNSTFFYKKK